MTWESHCKLGLVLKVTETRLPDLLLQALPHPPLPSYPSISMPIIVISIVHTPALSQAWK